MLLAGAITGSASRTLPPRKLFKLGLALVLAVGLGGLVHAHRTGHELGDVPLASLPAEARQTEQLIRRGGPFAHAKDGTIFGNREQLLPQEDRGFYREYTVNTPGSRTRGARRIVCGGRQATAPEACYYTADHYASFRRIAQ